MDTEQKVKPMIVNRNVFNLAATKGEFTRHG
ncbi:hypothetical protein J2Z58_001354 [Halobacillus andaensis]|nr:hypothetical protein [Halobacillus andaensis]